MGKDDFTTAFSTPDERVQSMANAVRPLLETLPARTVMDIGSGTGSICFALAGLAPDLNVSGVDISDENVRAAEQAAEQSARQGGLGERVRFHLADYRIHRTEPVGLIVSSSTLQNIPGDSHDLFAKVANDLLPGGYLVCTMPDGSLFNRVLWGVRRVFRALRCDLTDRVILLLAKALSRGKYSDDFLRERVGYMYLLPYSHDGVEFRKMLQRLGLVLRDVRPEPHASLGQPTHNLLILQREG